MILFCQSGDLERYVEIAWVPGLSAAQEHFDYIRKKRAPRARMLAGMYASRSDERELRRRFVQYRVEEKWFEPDVEILQFIARYAPEGRPPKKHTRQWKKEVFAAMSRAGHRDLVERKARFPDCRCDLLDLVDGSICYECTQRVLEEKRLRAVAQVAQGA